jgi:hypothetical protein
MTYNELAIREPLISETNRAMLSHIYSSFELGKLVVIEGVEFRTREQFDEWLATAGTPGWWPRKPGRTSFAS